MSDLCLMVRCGSSRGYIPLFGALEMAEKNLKDLLVHTLKDVYFAEHEILKALPEMEAAAEQRAAQEAFATTASRPSSRSSG